MENKIFLILLIFLFFIYFYFQLQCKENFLDNSYYTGRHTRNMSYDLRGEAYYPPILNLPFNNSELQSINFREFIF